MDQCLADSSCRSELSRCSTRGLGCEAGVLYRYERERLKNEITDRPHPLCSAVIRGEREEVEALLAKGAPVNDSCPVYRKSRGHQAAVSSNPLHEAIIHGHTELVLLLLEYKADLHVQDKQGRTPLHWAVMKRKADIVGVLLAHGANINIEDDFGMSPMRLAADPKVIEVLKQHASQK